jgi:hypothetical protein
MIAGHGEADPHDRNVSVVLAGTGVEDSDRNVQSPVETTQIALTSCARSSSTRELKAVQLEHAAALMCYSSRCSMNRLAQDRQICRFQNHGLELMSSHLVETFWLLVLHNIMKPVVSPTAWEGTG